MGLLAHQLTQKARRAGAKLFCEASIRHVHVGYPHHTIHVELDGKLYEIQTKYLLSNASDRVLHTLLDQAPPALTAQDEGTAFKINMLLRKLPVLQDPGIHPGDAFAGTFHINQSYSQLEKTFMEASGGRIPETLAGEMYCHTLTDPSILSKELQEMGYHTLTYFGLDLPYRLFVEDNQKAKQEVVRRFLQGINAYLAEPLEDCFARDAQGNICLEAKSALDLENELSLPLGNIFHKPLSWFFAEHKAEAGTWGVETHWERVFVCGASAKRGGAVSGIPGRNAAMAVLGL
jgi:phytoene dehydrogenase-like protein